MSKPSLACVANVPVGFGSKERPRKGIFGVLPARKLVREPKIERWGWWRGSKEAAFTCFLFLPLPLFYLLHSSLCNSLLPNPTETLTTQAKSPLNQPPQTGGRG